MENQQTSGERQSRQSLFRVEESNTEHLSRHLSENGLSRWQEVDG